MPHGPWRGDILVMRVGKEERHDVVNMQVGDGELADYAVRRLVQEVVQLTPIEFDPYIVVYKP
ncbi:hypothetical protein DXG01_010726 [Tephrocybe rancida]|nr:hypothetical protein DXG01_010726 [Tephrocybe rancida]